MTTKSFGVMVHCSCGLRYTVTGVVTDSGPSHITLDCPGCGETLERTTDGVVDRRTLSYRVADEPS